MAKNNKATKAILDENWDEILGLHRAGTPVADIAKQFNVSRQTLSARLKKNSKSLSTVPSHTSMAISKASTLYDSEGNVKIQWVKEERSKAAELEAFKEAIETFVSNPRIKSAKRIKDPSSIDKDTMSIYSIGDAHVGMLSWGEETGEDYDTTKCVADLIAAVDLLVDQAHASEEAFIIDVGGRLCRLV